MTRREGRRRAGARRGRLALAAAIGVVGVFGIGASSALADSLSIQLSTSTPEQGVPVTLTFSGTAAAIDSSGDGPYLYAVIRPSGGISCQATYGDDQAAAGAASTTVAGAVEVNANEPYSVQENFDPDKQGYIVCAWLETVSNDGTSDFDSQATPNEVTQGPVTASFSASGPKIGELNVSAPASIAPNQAYQITYTTQSDQNVSLSSVVIPAGGSGCASSYELETSSNQSYHDVFGGSVTVYGTQTTTGMDTESKAGAYVICTWLEGPDSGEVDASTSTDIQVGTTPVQAAPEPACVVPRAAGLTVARAKARIRAGHCSVGAVYYVKTRRVRRGRVIKLGTSAGRLLKHGARVAIIVSDG